MTALFKSGAMLRGFGRSIEGLAEGVALEALSVDALRRLTVRLYDRPMPGAERGLADWETRWFESALPPAPARIVLGGAGRGREAAWLRARGYELVLFDPVPALAAELPGGLTGGYEALVRPSSPFEVRFQAAVSARAPYDAAILGWGSFTHLTSEEDRLALLQFLHRHGNGNVLLSFWLCTGELVPSRSKRLGLRIGRMLGRRATHALKRDQVLPHCGFAHAFEREELEDLATRSGYCVRWEGAPDEFPHATLTPIQRPVP